MPQTVRPWSFTPPPVGAHGAARMAARGWGAEVGLADAFPVLFGAAGGPAPPLLSRGSLVSSHPVSVTVTVTVAVCP